MDSETGAERLACRTPDCPGTILPRTAEKTGGFCMPCVQKREQEERNEYVRENRVDVDRFDGVDDPVDVICLSHTRPAHDPLKNYLPYGRPISDVFAALAADDERRLIERTRQLLTTQNESERETGEQIALELACFTEGDLNAIQVALIENGSLYPGIVYRGAGASIVERLIGLLEMSVARGQPSLNCLLDALAWTEHERVVQLFTGWHTSIPSWAETLHSRPQTYAESAGWSVASSTFERLHPAGCRVLVERGQVQGAVTVVKATGRPCGFCNRPLSLLFDLDTRSDSLAFLELPPGRIGIPFCEVCSCYGNIHFDVGLDGSWTWSEENTRPSYLPPNEEEWCHLPEDRLALGTARRAITAAVWTVPNRQSQLGGMPTWVQDAEYPRCLGCAGIMRFVGQLACEDLMEAEGLHYAFLCLKCHKATTVYQQT